MTMNMQITLVLTSKVTKEEDLLVLMSPAAVNFV